MQYYKQWIFTAKNGDLSFLKLLSSECEGEQETLVCTLEQTVISESEMLLPQSIDNFFWVSQVESRITGEVRPVTPTLLTPTAICRNCLYPQKPNNGFKVQDFFLNQGKLN